MNSFGNDYLTRWESEQDEKTMTTPVAHFRQAPEPSKANHSDVFYNVVLADLSRVLAPAWAKSLAGSIAAKLASAIKPTD
jgi:hypothetical protein